MSFEYINGLVYFLIIGNPKADNFHGLAQNGVNTLLSREVLFSSCLH